MSDQQSAAETPKKDCPKCQLRRIKCDRSLPGCRKCAKRCLECPGYGMILKWGQGVASRGKLQGKSLPLRNSADEASGLPVFAPSRGPDVSGPIAIRNNFQPPSSASWSQHTQPLALLPSPTNPCLLDPRTEHVPQLLLYFNERIAPRLAWVDGPENPWRQTVMPLAENSETVLSSVLALTAQDLASQYDVGDVRCEEFQTISKSYSNRALGLLARELSVLRNPTVSRSETSISPTLSLASVIILCNSELLTAQEAGWRLHLQAAREIIRVELDRSNTLQPTDRTGEFFLQEFYATSVWTHLTAFQEVDNIIPSPPLASNKDAVFTDFIRIIHQVTQAERLKSHNQHLHNPQQNLIQDIDIHAQLEMARRSALRLSQSIRFWSEIGRCDFEHLVWMYHHASLVYYYQALADSPTSQALVHHLRDEMLSHLYSLSGSGNGMFAQDLVWPLFVAGTEFRGNQAGQATIERELTAVMRTSRTLDRNRVLRFLKSWWTQRDDENISWIEWARRRHLECDFLIA